MIEFLKISNLALLDAASIEFCGGFTAVTGETGAGKSVLLGALALLSGARSGKEIIKQGADVCKVEASLNFSDTKKLDEFLEANELPICEDGALILSRTLERSRGGKCLINGALTTISTLAQLGEFWIDFHGPGEPQKLFSPINQMNMLDDFAGLGGKKSEYEKLFKEYKDAKNKIEELSNARSLNADEAEFLREQIRKIDSVNPEENAIASLEENFKLAECAAELTEKSNAISEILNGDEGAGLSINQALRLVQEISDMSSEAESLRGRLEGVSIEIADIAAEFDALSSKTSSFSEEEIANLRLRMEAWMDIKRKYGKTLEMVLNARSQMAFKLDSQSDVKKTIADLESACKKIEKEIEPIAEKIFQLRLIAAENLSKKVEKLLLSLGFKKAKFAIEIKRSIQLSPNCGSACEFIFSANAGQAPLPLAKIASSGELARVMLALKATLAAVDGTALLVFDEVDANVGGEIGAKVGEELKALAESHQVLCVTHLPQVAASAANHLLVEKNQDDDSTEIFIRSLSAKSVERVSELARMLGDRNSDSALAHAKKLLNK